MTGSLNAFTMDTTQKLKFAEDMKATADEAFKANDLPKGKLLSIMLLL